MLGTHFHKRFVPLLLGCTLYGAAFAGSVSDELAIAARDGYRAGSVARVNATLAGLNGHPFEAYAHYWHLQMRLEEATPAELSAFFKRFSGTYVAEQLRKEWARSLGRRGQWELFEQVQEGVLTPEAELECYRLQSRWLKGDPTAASAALSYWEAPRELPDGCVPLAEAQLSAGQLTSAQVWQRIRALNAAGQYSAAKRMLVYLPPNETPDEKRLNAIQKDPQHFLERADRLDYRQRLNRELLIFALQRGAATDTEATASTWERLRPIAKLGETDEAFVWNQLGWQGARRHLPKALNWYALGEGAPLTDEQLEWRARAALRAQNWAEVRAAAERLPDALRNSPTWTYWQARAASAAGNAPEAERLWAQIAGQPNFYGKLAQEELGRPFVVPPRAPEPTAQEMHHAQTNPGLQRAIALFRADMWLEGVREWNWNLRDMDDRQLLAAAELAKRARLWDRAIAAADRTVHQHDYHLRYLAPYREQFAEQARANGLEEAWVLGLVRQESRFVAHARSPVGAAGLMQVMPATARWVAKRLGIGYHPGRIAEVDTNIALGTGYLRYVLEELENHPVLAAAAYNAGPGRARKWKADQPLEGAIYAETIPFSETRDYVKKVMTNTAFYAALNGGEERSLKQRLGAIPPRRTDEGYAPTITGQATLQ